VTDYPPPEILKHPLQTAVAVNTSDFENFNVQEKVHLTISVKDFKAIVAHAAMLNSQFSAYYSQPTRPLQFSYGGDGMRCEFTLMTAGDYRGTPATSAAPAVPSKPASRAQSTIGASVQAVSRNAPSMPPPAAPNLRSNARSFGKNVNKASSQQATAPSQDESETLFVPVEEDDRAWEPADYHEDQEEMLGWDASADNDAGFHPTFRDTGSMARTETQAMPEGIAPTQRVSQIKGLW